MTIKPSEYHSQWQNARLNFIFSKYPEDYFKDKKVLELGAFNGYIGAQIANKGATVHCIEGRQENVDNIKLNYPNLTVEKANLDSPIWKWGKWDIIINFGLYYHLTNYHREHLVNCVNNTNLLFFETVVFDSLQPVIYFRKEMGNDQALQINAGTPSTLYVENILSDFNVKFEKFSDSILNGNSHHYDWLDTGNEKFDQFARRFWIIEAK
jgi:hypothetical protein